MSGRQDTASFPCAGCRGPTLVVDSRPSPYGTRRRRRCSVCGLRFTTYERSDWPMVAEEEMREAVAQFRQVADTVETWLSRIGRRRTRRPMEAEPKVGPPLDDEPVVGSRG